MRVVVLDLKRVVENFEDLNAPNVEYAFQARRFSRDAHYNPVTAANSTARTLSIFAPRSVLANLRDEVMRVENLSAPNLEYDFTHKRYYRNVNSTTGIYE